MPYGRASITFPPINIPNKRVYRSKETCNLKYIYSNRLNLGKIRSHEDVFWSFAPHDISLLQYFIGADPLDISSNSHSFVGQKADIQITHLKYPNGVKAHIHSSWLNPLKNTA